MSVWLTIPSARPVDQVNAVLDKWRALGYKIALWRDQIDTADIHAERVISGVNYPGYAVAVNELVAHVMKHDRNAEWFVTGGDDVWPEPNKTAEEIAMECSDHFGILSGTRSRRGPQSFYDTFGVMQPTADRWGDKQGAYIDRVAGSPWIGREFARRIYGGKGPYWPEYTHMGVDEEIQAVAEKYGVFWQRPDLMHYHDHWGRPKPGETMGHAANMPDFLKHANSRAEWDRYKAIFAARKAAGFPGSEPIA